MRVLLLMSAFLAAFGSAGAAVLVGGAGPPPAQAPAVDYGSGDGATTMATDGDALEVLSGLVLGLSPKPGSGVGRPGGALERSIANDELATTDATRTVVGGAQPTVVQIPAVDIEVTLDPIGLTPDGELAVPEDFSRGGWYEEGPAPGEPGPAVVTAHVDSYDGPAPFFRLADVAPGHEIVVDFDDGRTATFVVDRVEQHAKDEFPTLAVYGNTEGPELRLITCGGDFDGRARSYRDNVIVWAHQT